MLLAFEQSQKEVDDLSQRIKEGIETARRTRSKSESIGEVRRKEKPVKEMARRLSRSFEVNLKDKEVIAVTNSGGLIYVGGLTTSTKGRCSEDKPAGETSKKYSYSADENAVLVAKAAEVGTHVVAYADGVY